LESGGSPPPLDPHQLANGDEVREEIFGVPRPELIARWRKLHEVFDEPRLVSLLTTFGYAQPTQVSARPALLGGQA